MNLNEYKRKGSLFFKKYLYYKIPKNYNRYKVRGLYESVHDFINSHIGDNTIYNEIYPQRQSEFKLPVHLAEISSDYIKYPAVEEEPAKYILKIENARIITDCLWTIGIFDEKNKLIGDISLDLFLKNSQSISDSRILKRKFFKKHHHLKGVVFHTLAGGGSYNNYAHWLLDSISKIHFLKKSGLFEQVDWFYVPTIEYDYQIDSLKALGIPENKIVESNKYPHIKADTLLAPSYSRGSLHIPDWIVDFIYEQFPPIRKPKYKTRRFFISRKDSSVRNIVNEDELKDVLEEYEIGIIILSKLSFQEKIDLFANAELIISLSGAALTNLIFCKENTTVLELFGDQFIDFTYYYSLASKRKLDYHFLIGNNTESVKTIPEGQKSNVSFDKESFKNELNNVLNLSN